MNMRGFPSFPFPVTRRKKPRKYVGIDKFDEFSDEKLWNCYKNDKSLDFKTFKSHLPDIRAFHKQIRLSEGFDIDVVPKVGMTVGALLPDDCCPELWPEKYQAFMELAQAAIWFYNTDNRKLFHRFEVVKVDKVNTKLDGLYHQHYMIFTAVNIGRRGVRGDPLTFQTLVLTMGCLVNNRDLEKIIEFVRIKPEAALVEETTLETNRV